MGVTANKRLAGYGDKLPKSAHFINKREGMGREGLSRLEGNRYRSCCWTISADEARSLVGGWIYLHDAKGHRSAFGGLILLVEPAQRVGTAREEGFAIIFEAKNEARQQRWRGANHAMAWWGGPVEPDAKHEGVA